MNTWFKAKVTRGGRRRSLHWWQDGKLLGDPTLIWWVQRDAAAYEGHYIGHIPFPGSTHDHLKHPYTVIMLLELLHDRGTQVELVAGDIEPIPPPPEGAVY